MLINSIGFKYNNKNNIVFSGERSSKKSETYEPALNIASKNVMEYFSNERNKIQKAYDKFNNYWGEHNNKAFQLIYYTPVNVKFYSSDKSENVSILDKNTVAFEDKNSKKLYFEDNKWSDEIDGLENSLMDIVNNNVKDGDEKANLMFTLSDVFFNKLLAEKDSSDSKIVNNIHNLFECVTNMYNARTVEDNARQFFVHNCLGKSHHNLKQEGWKISDDDYRTYLSFNNKNEFYEFFDKERGNILVRYERKCSPKYLLYSSPLSSSYNETFFDAQGNQYNKSCYNNFFGSWIATTEAEIKGFGNIKCKNVLKDNLFYYTISQKGKEPQTYKLDINTGLIVKNCINNFKGKA